jgi:hypothetical protein
LFQRGKIVERNRRAARKQRLETATEVRIVRQRQRAVSETVVGVRAIDNAGPSGRATGELDGGLDAFRAGIGEKHLVQIRDIFEQPLSQHAGERRNIELDEIWQIAIENALERLTQGRMVPANRKNAKTAQ